VCENSIDKLSGLILRSKISTKLLTLIGSKTVSLRDNQLKSFTSNKSNRIEFIDKTYKHKKELCTISPLLFNAQIKNPRDSDRICFCVFLSIIYLFIILCLVLIIECALKVCRWNSDTLCIFGTFSPLFFLLFYSIL
jgi:hypothetical protein